MRPGEDSIPCRAFLCFVALSEVLMEKRIVAAVVCVGTVLLALSLVFTCVGVAFAFGCASAFSLAAAFCCLGFLLCLCAIGRIKDDYEQAQESE